VADTQKIKADVFGHHGVVEQGTLAVGDTVTASVNLDLRAATVRNHSATHLMHKALREVLGEHVQQKGSLVNAERTRFDFAHNAPVTDQQIRRIEGIVNAEILPTLPPGAVDGHRVGQENRRHDAVRREVRRYGARARHRQQPRTVRWHPRAAHR
jgi:alanyl-tRNA synthetase